MLKYRIQLSQSVSVEEERQRPEVQMFTVVTAMLQVQFLIITHCQTFKLFIL